MRRTTHETEIQFGLDPEPHPRHSLTIYAAAEQTYRGHEPDFTDPGALPEFDLHTVQIYDHQQSQYRALTEAEWETLFGPGSWQDLLDFLEGELEEAG